MNQNEIEEKRNKLNLDTRVLLSVIDIIDGQHKEYENYEPNNLTESQFLDEQITLVNEAKDRLINIFKD